LSSAKVILETVAPVSLFSSVAWLQPYTLVYHQ